MTETETSAAISVPPELTIDALLDIGWPEYSRWPRAAIEEEVRTLGWKCREAGVPLIGSEKAMRLLNLVGSQVAEWVDAKVWSHNGGEVRYWFDRERAMSIAEKAVRVVDGKRSPGDESALATLSDRLGDLVLRLSAIETSLNALEARIVGKDGDAVLPTGIGIGPGPMPSVSELAWRCLESAMRIEVVVDGLCKAVG